MRQASLSKLSAIVNKRSAGEQHVLPIYMSIYTVMLTLSVVFHNSESEFLYKKWVMISMNNRCLYSYVALMLLEWLGEIPFKRRIMELLLTSLALQYTTNIIIS